MRSGCDRAADMMLIRTGRRRFFGIDDADRPRRPGIVSGVRFESARHRDDRLRECRSIDRLVPAADFHRVAEPRACD
jgi:hypothetical protein